MAPDFWTGGEALKNRATAPPGYQPRILRDMFSEKRSQVFDPSWIRLGFRRLPSDPEHDAKANAFQISTRKAERMLVLGMTGSGKSVMLRRLGDFYHHSGYGVLYITDIKNEMRTSKKPAGEKMARLLDPSDAAAPMRMKVYRPRFFSRTFRETMPPANEPFAIAYHELTLPDLLRALGFDHDRAANQKNVLSVLYNRVDSMEELAGRVESEVENSGIRDSILRAVKPLIAIGAFPSEPVGDVVADLEEGFAVVLNMNAYDRISIGSATLPQVYVSIVQRLVVQARERAKHNRGPRDSRLRRNVVVFVDEAPKFLVPGTLTYSELLAAVDLYRQLGVSMVFAAQTSDKIPASLIDQCRYLFLPYNIKPKTAWDILQNSHYYRYHPAAKQVLIDKLRGLRVLRDGRRNWVCVDTEEKRTDIFYSYPALSAHLEE